jgi:hypothetical protein
MHCIVRYAVADQFSKNRRAARVRAGKAAAEWQPLLDRALEKFHAAGCAQADIDGAVATHAGKLAK